MSLLFERSQTLGSVATRVVTLHGSAQIESRPSDTEVKNFLLWELQNTQLIGVADLSLSRSWYNSLAGIDITVIALGSQSKVDVERIIANAFRNIAAKSAANLAGVQIWNPSAFTVTSGNWSTVPQEGSGYVGTPQEGSGQGNSSGSSGTNGCVGWNCIGSSTPANVYTEGSTPQSSGTDPFKQVTEWIEGHKTEAALGAALFLILLMKK